MKRDEIYYSLKNVWGTKTVYVLVWSFRNFNRQPSTQSQPLPSKRLYTESKFISKHTSRMSKHKSFIAATSLQLDVCSPHNISNHTSELKPAMENFVSRVYEVLKLTSLRKISLSRRKLQLRTARPVPVWSSVNYQWKSVPCDVDTGNFILECSYISDIPISTP